MAKEDAFTRLIEALKVLPNVGPKTAQRMAYQLLQNNRDGALLLQQALADALAAVRHCRLCNTLCESEVCELCADTGRRDDVLMIVHHPVDVSSMEAAHCHDGRYFVLMGYVNPTQGMDLNQIAIRQLVERLQTSHIAEIIIATKFTAEGDATAYVIHQLLKDLPYKVTRLARGMPLGGELEYVDAGTLAQAVYERRQVEDKGL